MRTANNLGWIFSISHILSTLRLYSGGGMDLGLCPDIVSQCQCGSDPNVRIGIPLKQCSFIHQCEPYCKPCNGLEEKDVCPKFSTCKLCESGRCTACPFNRFGQWCEKDCKCQNGADCDINGFCQCLNGFEGRFCETNNEITCSYLPIPKYGSLKVLPCDETLSQSSRLSRIGRPHFRRTRNANRSCTADHAILPEGRYSVGTRVSYECESRYYDIIGSQYRRCQSDGTWSGRDVTCNPVCGRSNSPKTPFIKNGNATEIGQWPWQVGISLFLEEHNEWYLQCGGSLISESLVLTAAHCVNDNTEKSRLANLKFHFGKYHRNNNLDDDMVQERKAKEIYVHHNYDSNTFDSDIAVVLLDVPVTLTSRVQPICLPTEGSTRVNIVDGTKGVVTGWGRLDEEGEDSETLRQAVMPVVGHEKCEIGYKEAGLRISVSEYMFCAGYEHLRVDTCPGDSGGPMVFEVNSKKMVLEGIVSWGSPKGCGTPGQYGAFTWVHKFLPWIRQFT